MSTLPRVKMPRVWLLMPFLDEFLRHLTRRMSQVSRQPTVVRTSIFRTSTRAAYILTMPADSDTCSSEIEEKDSFHEFSEIDKCFRSEPPGDFAPISRDKHLRGGQTDSKGLVS